MNNQIESIIGDYKNFLDKVFGNLREAGFDLEEFKELDHIAYRAENLESYAKVKKELLKFSKNYNEKMFGGRLVLVCLLENPIVYNSFTIKGFELLAPKENNSHKEGLEHAEFVIKISLQEFQEKHRNIDFDLHAYNREENPELVLNFENCSAKFHTQSLLEVRGIY
ncbi:MAG: VOC family protein [Candidatus Moraniibacteriota bacterium]